MDELLPCPSCHGLNTSCPDGCGRDPKTGELDGSRLAATQPAAVEQDVERVARAIDPGLWKLLDNPDWFMPDNPQDVERKEASLSRARAALSALTPARAEGFKAGLEAAALAVAALKTCGCNGAHGLCMEDDPYDNAAEIIRALKESDHG